MDRNTTQARKASAAATAAVRAYRQAKKAQAAKMSPKELLGPIAKAAREAAAMGKNKNITSQEVMRFIQTRIRPLQNQAQNLQSRSGLGGSTNSIIRDLNDAANINEDIHYYPQHRMRRIAQNLQAAYDSVQRWIRNNA